MRPPGLIATCRKTRRMLPCTQNECGRCVMVERDAFLEVFGDLLEAREEDEVDTTITWTARLPFTKAALALAWAKRLGVTRSEFIRRAVEFTVKALTDRMAPLSEEVLREAIAELDREPREGGAKA